MFTKVKIGVLASALAQASYTLDSKAGSLGSFITLIARATKGDQEARMYVYSTNMGLARTLLKIPADVTKDGIAVVSAKLLRSLITTLPPDDDIELTLSPSGARLQVKYEQIKSEIAVHADSQKMSEVLSTIPFNAKSDVTVSAAVLVDIITRTLFCTASSTMAISEGPWLSNVLLEAGDGSLIGTATNRIIAGKAEVHDGLVTSGFSGGCHRDALIALKAILSKRETEEVTITRAIAKDNTANELLFRFSDAVLGVRQLSKPYPKAVEKIFTIPGSFSTATVDRRSLVSVFSRLSAFSEAGSFTLSFVADKVRLTAKGYNSQFEEVVPKTEKTDGTITVGLATNDMISILQAMRGDTVVLRYGTADDHVHIQEGDSPFRYVLSPVQVPWTKGSK